MLLFRGCHTGLDTEDHRLKHMAAEELVSPVDAHYAFQYNLNRKIPTHPLFSIFFFFFWSTSLILAEKTVLFGEIIIELLWKEEYSHTN